MSGDFRSREVSKKGRYVGYLIVTLVSGVVLVVSPLIGMAGTVFGMRKAFVEMEGSGVKDPEVISESIGEVLISTAAGFAGAIIGLPLFILFLVLAIRERRRLSRIATAIPGENH